MTTIVSDTPPPRQVTVGTLRQKMDYLARWHDARRRGMTRDEAEAHARATQPQQGVQ